MATIKLFRCGDGSVNEIYGEASPVEKKLQNLIEANLETILGIRFLATEYSTGKTHGGRIDTLGLDENGVPVIIEYKRNSDQNVINQGLFYLDWLLDHRAEFERLVRTRIDDTAAEEIDWDGPRLLCVAGDFTKYDVHAVQQIDQNIELHRYQHFGKDLLLLEQITSSSVDEESKPKSVVPEKAKTGRESEPISGTHADLVSKCDPEVLARYNDLLDRIRTTGEEIEQRELKHWIAFRRVKNFASVEVRPTVRTILLFLRLDPKEIDLEKGFSRDVSSIGHFGTGDLELTIRSDSDVEKAMKFVKQSYERN